MKKGFNLEESKKLYQIIDARDGECMANVIRAFLDFPETLPDAALQVEGLYYYGGQLIVHTWIETDDEIIDPTVVVNSPNDNIISDLRYFALLERSTEEISLKYSEHDRNPGGTFAVSIDGSDIAQKCYDEIDNWHIIKYVSKKNDNLRE